MAKVGSQGREEVEQGALCGVCQGGKRYVVPLKYLDHPIFQVLLEMAEEEFGTTSHGPLRVPCEEELMEHIVFLLKTNPAEDVEKALVSITSFRGPSFSSLFPLCHSQNNRHNIVL
ncbi:auxin-induced protein 6B-like [Elaeis guineensis]|uniref:auxin-induced protein 6B-like n=1 Tax=Elaeis guineensis var. tenera TaxID=51953 RepID=UPI003C6D69AC